MGKTTTLKNSFHMAFKVTQEWVDTVVDTAKDMVDTPSQVTVDTPSQNMVDIPSQNTLNQNTPSHQHMVGTPSHLHTVDTPSHLHTVDTPSHLHTVGTPSHQHTVDTLSQLTVDTPIMVINQSQRTNHTATITDHHMEVTQDRRMDNLWATMAHPPMAHLVLPKVTTARHVILKATMVLPNKDRHSLKIKLVRNNLI